ncbi:MAG: YfhO family protein [Lachnospiraceae bacterium]|nr:YfhO family protein [Ruminococcus sp.]MCM1274575.1 YfhO family protein [Lachnospiraceae bacterium]
MKKALYTAREFIVRKKAYFLAALLPPAIMYVAYAIFGMYPFGEKSVLGLDLNAQYVYYFDYMYDVFAGKESIFYCWSGSLSGEFLGLFAYYLASPFNIIVWLFPRESITEGIMAMQLAKCAAVGFSAALMLKRRRGFSEYTAVLFSVMYALSGYFTAQTVNPMWLDGLIALPLVLMGVERVCDGRKFLLYTLSLIYIFVANFYIGYMVGIFSAIYFVYYIASGKCSAKGFRSIFASTAVYGFASVAGILSSGFMILPVYKSLSNGKFAFGNPDYSFKENFNLADCLIKLFPATFDTIRPEGLPMLYCGTLGILFAVIYFMHRRIPLRERVSGGFVLGLLFLSMYIKPVDMFWHGGQVPVWMPFRYSFIISFLLILFGAEAFEKISSLRGKSLGAAFAVLLGILLLSDYNAGHERFDTTLIIVIPLIALGVTAAAAAAYKKRRGPLSHSLFACLVCIELLANTAITFYKLNKDIYYSPRDTYVDEIPPTRGISESVHELDGGFYRMEKTYHRCVNDTMAARMYGMSHSTSTFNSKAIALLKKLGYGAREHYTRYDGATLLTDDIFGVKYVLSKSELLSQYTDSISVENGLGVTVYENKDVLPLAYLADGELIGEDLGGDNPFEAQTALAELLTGDEESIYERIFDYIFNCENINIGSTTDDHASYKKRNADADASISYEITAPHSGAVYMYLPTKYERKCYLYVNGSYIKDYFESENHSIAYLGTYDEGETFTAELKLPKDEDAIYVEEALFYYLDEERLAEFNGKLQSMNAGTSVTRTGGSSLEIKVDAAEDCALFTSIPFEEGWTAFIDGREAKVLSTVDSTLMCIEVPEGAHTIELKFFPAGLKSGLLITGSGILLIVIMLLAERLSRREPPSAEDEYEGFEDDASAD